MSSRLKAIVAWGNALLRLNERPATVRSYQASRQPDRRARTRRSPGKRRVVVYGAGACGRKLLDAVRLQPEKELQILGVFDDRMTHPSNRTEWPEVSGGSDDLIRLAQTQQVHEVIVALPRTADARLNQLVEKLCVLPAAITLYDGLTHGEIDDVSGVRRRALLRRHQTGFYRSDALAAGLINHVTPSTGLARRPGRNGIAHRLRVALS